MKMASLILGMRIGNMGYMQFSLVFHKGTEGLPPPTPFAHRDNSNTSDFDEI